MAEAPAPKKSPSAVKRARQNVVRHARNVAIKSSLKTVNKKFLAAVDSAEKATAETLYRETTRAFDKAVSKHVIHPNKAARKKSRLARQLAKAGTVKS